ncbi:MAG TPA: hypothetical protein VIM51_06660 [Desulfosporosinus sp.]
MFFPYGEWIIFFLALVTWTEKRASQRLFLRLTAVWIIGKYLEGSIPTATPWHWHFARLSVMFVFWIWAWRRAERRVIPLLLTSFTLSIETLFIVNEPGVFPYEPWLFTIVLIVISWLTTKSYWGTAAAFVGSIIVNQALVRFTYEGIVRYVDLPDPFVWNFGVGFLAMGAGLHLAWRYNSERERAPVVERLCVPGLNVYEPSEECERELQ